MPTEVTVGGYHHHQPFYHQAPYMSMNQGGWATSHSLPNPYLMTGPLRAIDCIPQPSPNAVMAKGIRNPYVPYMGETYRPAAEGAANRQSALMGGASQPYASGMGIGMGMSLGGSGGGRGSMIAPSMMGGGSVMSSPSAYGGQGGYRVDDGWEGSMGRSHCGHAPDLSSTAGAIPRRPIASQLAPPMAMGMGIGHLNLPSSPMNHARMSPSPIYADIPPPLAPIKRSGSQRAPSHHAAGRRVSIDMGHGHGHGHAQGHAGDGCRECDNKAKSRGGRRMSDGQLSGMEGSSLRRMGDEGLNRKVSNSSRRSGRDSFSSER